MRIKNLFLKTLCIMLAVILVSALPVNASDDMPDEIELCPGPDQVMLTIKVDGEPVTSIDKGVVRVGSIAADYIEGGAYWFNSVPCGTNPVTILGFDTEGIKAIKTDDDVGKGIALELNYSSLNDGNTTITLAGDVLIQDGAEKIQKIASVKVAGISEPLVEGVDYFIVDSTDRATDTGSYNLKIRGMGKFVGEASCDWLIAESSAELSKKIVDKVKPEVIIEAGASQVELSTSDDKLPAAILSADTAADLVSEGGTLSVQVGTVDASSQKELAAFADGWTVAQYLSVDLVFTGKDSGKVIKIAETNTPLSLTVTLPDNMKYKSDSEFGVVRSHGVDRTKSKITLENSCYNAEEGIMRFENDKYSDFAIVYKAKETVPATNSDGKPDVVNSIPENANAKPADSSNAVSPKTGDYSSLVLLAATLGIAGFALVSNKLYGKKKNGN